MKGNARLIALVSVYNEQEYLHETVPALLAQTMTDVRFVVLDNGSTDGSRPILAEYAQRDPRITLLLSPTNLTPPVVANRLYEAGMRIAPTARWLLACGADDLVEADYFEALMDAAGREPSVNCLYPPKRLIGDAIVTPFPTYDPATIHAQVQIPNWRAVTRELWHAVGPQDERIRIGADWEWAVRASAAGVFRPLQLEHGYLSLRVRPPGRTTQSLQVDWPALHRHLCGVVGAQVPAWAQGR